MTSIKIQVYIFLTSIYSGIIAGIVYDLYRSIRYYLKPNRIVTGIEDLLFWIGEAFIFFYIFSKGNWGQLRGYIFVGFLFGIIIYINILSKFLFPIFLKIFSGIIFIFKWIIYIIKFPFKKLKGLASPRLKKIKKIHKEAISENKRYRKIISRKK